MIRENLPTERVARTSTWAKNAKSRLWLPVLMCVLAAFVASCGGDTGSSTRSSNPAPFDTAKGEGSLISSQPVVIYPTAASDGPLALDTYYVQTICPTQLSQSQCTQNENNLNTPQFGNFDVTADPIANNPLGIKLVDAAKLDYTAINVNGAAVTVSGGILIPEIAASSLKGMILYFHGTTVQRSSVPSNFLTSGNAGTADTSGILLAAVWASQGYVVVMPDYIGSGDDAADVHPYVVYPQQNAQSGLAMVLAARSFLSATYGIDNSLPFFVTGYSEGGAYALEAAHLMQSNPRYASELDVVLKEAAPLSGFFDLSGTGLSYLFDNITPTNNNWDSLSPALSGLSKPYLMAYLALGFANYSGIAPTDILASAFYTPCAQGPITSLLAGFNYMLCTTGDNLDALYYTDPQNNLSTPFGNLTYDNIVTFQTAIDQAPAVPVTPVWSYGGLPGMTTNNGIAPLLTTTYANALMNQDRSNPLYHQLLQADTYKFVPRFPVALVSLMQDSVVTRKNSDVAFAYFTAKKPNGPYTEDLVDNNNFLVYGFDFSTFLPTPKVLPVDHTSELPFMSVLILNKFNTNG